MTNCCGVRDKAGKNVPIDLHIEHLNRTFGITNLTWHHFIGNANIPAVDIYIFALSFSGLTNWWH